jgi:hypothetical protein
MKTLGSTRQCVKRRVDANVYAHAFWMRYWDLNYRHRWSISTTPTISSDKRGNPRNGRPIVHFAPVDESVFPIRVGGMLTGLK